MSAPLIRKVEAPELGQRVMLAIDTSLGTSVAVGASGWIAEVSSDDPRGHAEHIGTLIAQALAAATTDASSITDVVAGMGPGPFTGLRVGIAAAHAFAVGRGLSVLPLVSHDAAALDLLETGAISGVRVVQDAKRRELFVTEYSALDWAGVPVRSADPHLVPREGYVSVSNEARPERVSAAALVRLAARMLAAGREFEADRALYLRQPDVMPPSAPKPVTP
ncbi:tRNA (adenosine(37)-N6)-threonylcarbamoyltransferase complex dimerization subunit type 1 TsaB [Leucobacter denitrificans]|uniref:tRNA (Adenosine(37)-N6)-threonylcarbamoyltransferase complex dimerization subunit type 1 TsaB n=1 Tax=Leucobacter denitrificans TaxID=683042 RepID=A0A7G9S6M1_9MICO|nr:tRNA (adenosine(37)-N6)-threonylcarbamoyltransferase complex dimerization subunit type 1 TsaB [Leucobacter denitrificans]QNN63496.1 tRNA (adenosine(37)-N6)-threonylcarbamoyltransferase complex dimerization subunit type 1 TsaB [Leucobacter denitrificans]